MCTNKKRIFNRYSKKWLYVECGKCPACQQAAANKRASRIRANYEPGLFCWFVHLTYLNECVPYVLRSDLTKNSKTINIYRDYDRRLSRVRDSSGIRRYLIRYHRLFEPIDNYSLENDYGLHEWDKIDDIQLNLKDLTQTYHRRLTTKDMTGKIGVAYYPDLQNYIKKVKQNLIRKYNINTNEVHFSYYATSEYGTEKESLRPHFHLLVFCPRALKAQFYNALVSSWTFAFRRITERRLEPAIDASKYTASYVNKPADFPPLLSSHSFRQKFSYSQGFGIGLYHFKLTSILEKIKRGDMRYPRQVIVNGTPQQFDFLLPSYVINRHFPKFKGYSRITNDSIRRIFFALDSIPGRAYEAVTSRLALINYEYKLDYSYDDVHHIAVSLINHWKRSGLSAKDYSEAYVGAWTAYYSTLYRNLLENKSPIQQLECYDNIEDYYSGDISSESLDDLMFLIPSDYDVEEDPNLFRENVAYTECLEQQFNKRIKQLKINSNFVEDYA